MRPYPQPYPYPPLASGDGDGGNAGVIITTQCAHSGAGHYARARCWRLARSRARNSELSEPADISRGSWMRSRE